MGTLIFNLLSFTSDLHIVRIESRGSSGRLQVSYFGEWGTVCSDRWDIDDANVACRWLGYDGAYAAKTMASYGEGSGPIWVDNIRCHGHELTLNECKKRPLGDHNCGHEKDAGVECSVELTPFRISRGLLLNFDLSHTCDRYLYCNNINPSTI